MLATSRNQSDAAAIGRDVEVLARVGAVEQQRVEAVLAFDNVAAVARVPGERVVADAEKSDIVAASADHAIVAVAPDQCVGALTAGDGVVARAAVDREADDSGRQRSGVDRVVAGAADDGQPVVRAFRSIDIDRRGQPGDGDGGPGAGDADDIIVACAGHSDVVGCAIAERSRRPLRERSTSTVLRRFRSSRRSSRYRRRLWR